MNWWLLRYLRARWRLFAAVVIGVIVYWMAPLASNSSTRWLIAWNIASGSFLVLALVMMVRATEEGMQRRAQRTDEGRFAVLAMSMVAAAVSLAAIVVELSQIRKGDGTDTSLYVGLSVLTIFMSWAFIQMIFTEHYAHEYYIQRGDGPDEGRGLTFPGEKKPNYIDFLYFTVTIGVANQTADIAIRSRKMRILVLVHSVISYFFNATILALGINIMSSVL